MRINWLCTGNFQEKTTDTDTDLDAKDFGLGDTDRVPYVTFFCDCTTVKWQEKSFAVSRETHVAEYSNSP